MSSKRQKINAIAFNLSTGYMRATFGMTKKQIAIFKEKHKHAILIRQLKRGYR
jgi:hypothetical protein